MWKSWKRKTLWDTGFR